jgi:hypothetical protein
MTVTDARIKNDPADASGCLGTVTGEVGNCGRQAFAPLRPAVRADS